jgi:deoxyribodipyrimidine photo-lyase
MESKNNTESPIAIFWHRRDLRMNDNAGLFQALCGGLKVLPVFIFDTQILDKLNSRKDARVEFIHLNLEKLKSAYEKHGGSLLVKTGKPDEIFRDLIKEYNIKAVFTNADYEPYAIKRDDEISKLLNHASIEFRVVKDHVIFEKDEVVKADGTPYTVYTPYMRRWKERLLQTGLESYDVTTRIKALMPLSPLPYPTLAEIGFEKAGIPFPDSDADLEIIRKYHLQRNLPALKGTTRLGVHLRFGTLSTREMVNLAEQNNETWLNELIWREFFQMILHHFPQTVEKSFKPAYDRVEWLNNEKQFRAWCEGKTGFPIVDAGMRELAATGFMHNRVRMVTGSFLVKHLLVDWRWGEAWFAEKLLDYEQASNVGNWQWVAGSGCDAAPYFRVFNPELQAKKFDPKAEYIRQWVPEIDSGKYPPPIVEHSHARERALKAYKDALGN